jgi:hypothetical protein
MLDLKYPTAVGHLQAAASFAAIDIESIVRNVAMDAWAKEDLLNVARKLRAADKEAESMCSPEINGGAHQGRASGPTQAAFDEHIGMGFRDCIDALTDNFEAIKAESTNAEG